MWSLTHVRAIRFATRDDYPRSHPGAVLAIGPQLFENEKGGPMRYAGFNFMLKRLAARAGGDERSSRLILGRR